MIDHDTVYHTKISIELNIAVCCEVISKIPIFFKKFRLFTKKKTHTVNIGGHGFLDKGGVDTGGCPQKNFPAAFGGQKIFSPAPPPGGEKFFSVGCLFSRPGGDFAQKT